MILSLIVAYAIDGDGRYVIGKDNSIPWHYSRDLKWFREHTMGHVVIMGRKTFESIGKPLEGRDNIIVTRQENYKVPGAHVFGDLVEALCFAAPKSSEVFIIGGQTLYEQTLDKSDRLYVTYVHQKGLEGDTFFPKWERRLFRSIQKETGEDGSLGFEILQRIGRGKGG